MPDDKKKRFYHEQRLRAEETGDQATSDKIRHKIGWPSIDVDADRVNKDILGTVATPMAVAAAPEAGAAGAVGTGLARMGAGAVAGQAMRGMGQATARVIPQAQQALGGAMHPIDAALHVLESKLPGVTEKIEQAIGEHHESLGGSNPFKTYTKALPAPKKALPGGVQKGAKSYDIDYRGKEMAPKSARSAPAKNPKEQGMQNDIDYIRNKQINKTRVAKSSGKSNVPKQQASESTSPVAGRKGSQTTATPKQKGQMAAKEQTPATGVKSGHKPSVGGEKPKPGPDKGKTSAAPNKAPARTHAASKPKSTSAAAKNPYSKEGIAAVRGPVPKNVGGGKASYKNETRALLRSLLDDKKKK